MRCRAISASALCRLYGARLDLVCRCAACVCPSPRKRISRAKPFASVDLYPRTSTTGHHMVQLTIQDMELHRMMSLYHLMLIVNHVVAVVRKGNLI